LTSYFAIETCGKGLCHQRLAGQTRTLKFTHLKSRVMIWILGTSWRVLREGLSIHLERMSNYPAVLGMLINRYMPDY
jgi:hypothetical protein